MQKNILIVCGTRPEIIKMAPVYQALRQSTCLNPVVMHTGQHTSLAEPVYEFFKMNPDHRVHLNRGHRGLSGLSSALLNATAEVLEQVKPAAVLVHGDTSSAAMAALAAFYEQIPIGHVEAGLRTYDKYSPFPEEMNRSLIGRMAHWHYAPTPRAKQALLQENIAESDIVMTGNTVVDAALLTAAQLQEGHRDPYIEGLGLADKVASQRLVLVTAHRRENWGEGLEQITDAAAHLHEQYPDLVFVWPLHANPDVSATVKNRMVQRGLAQDPRILLTEPADYVSLIWLLKNAFMVLTDSGGIQEEAAAFGAPVLVLRESTERPELIEAGGGVLVGARTDSIVKQATHLLTNPCDYDTMRWVINPFGDGTAAQRIRLHLESKMR